MRLHLLTSATALLLLAGAVHADPGGGKGKGGGGGPPAGHGGGKHEGGGPKGGGPDKGPDHKGPQKHGGPEQAHGKPDRGPKRAPVERRAEAPRGPDKFRGPDDRGKPDKAWKGAAEVARGGGPDRAGKGPRDFGPGKSGPREAYREQRGGPRFSVPEDRRTRVITRVGDYSWGSYAPRGKDMFKGCPPGLAKKYNGCIPPGLARAPQDPWYQPTWYGRDRGSDYRYADGYLLRSSGNSILSYIPLLGGALAVGQLWPQQVEPVALPPYYADYYDLGPANSYRYYDDTIYSVDPGNSQISNVLALLTGSDIAIGQPMPAGYDVYNVPYAYRDRYYDTPDARYRYSDGAIYQIDPTTQLVQAAIELLTT